MGKKIKSKKLIGHSKQLPGKDTDSGLIKTALDNAGKFKKPTPDTITIK